MKKQAASGTRHPKTGWCPRGSNKNIDLLGIVFLVVWCAVRCQMVARPTSDGVVVAPAAAVVETADIGGWRIRATRGPIASSAECESVGAAAGVSAPTMLFAGSGLTLHRRCGSGGGEGEGEVALTFSAEDALSKVGRDSGVAVRAAGAAGWAARRAQYAVHGTRDWTYTTSYGGSVSGMRGSTSTAGRSALYDEAALRDGTRPIRFYADVPLFEDELDDNGVSSYRVRIVRMVRAVCS